MPNVVIEVKVSNKIRFLKKEVIYMEGLSDKTINSTIIKCQKVLITKNKQDGTQELTIKMHPTSTLSDIAALINCLRFRFSKEEDIILDSCIASLMKNAHMGLSQTTIQAFETHTLTIPLEKYPNILIATKLKIHQGPRGGLSREFDLEPI